MPGRQLLGYALLCWYTPYGGVLHVCEPVQSEISEVVS